jgi:hypothetical protein
MTLHLFLRFLHIAGSLGVFAALGVEIAALAGLRGASGKEAQRSIALFDVNRRLGPPSLVCILVPGVVMTSMSWGWQGDWIRVSFGGLVAIVIVGAAVTGRRIQRLKRELDGGGNNVDLAGQTSDPALVASLLARCGLALGVVFVMTTKPEAAIAIGALATGASLGLVPLLSRRSPA